MRDRIDDRAAVAEVDSSDPRRVALRQHNDGGRVRWIGISRWIGIRRDTQIVARWVEVVMKETFLPFKDEGPTRRI